MDKATIREHLVLAERHVRLDASLIATQKAIITKYVRDGGDTTMAQQLLFTFEEMQVTHIADRDRLARELAASGK
jgi:hypothetical protein